MCSWAFSNMLIISYTHVLVFSSFFGGLMVQYIFWHVDFFLWMQRRWKKTLKLRFLSQKLHEYRFIFLLCLSKLKFLCSWAFSDMLPPPFSIFISKLHEYRFVFLLRFPFPSSSTFSFFTFICICMRFFISVFCFFTACSLFLLKLRFLS